MFRTASFTLIAIAYFTTTSFAQNPPEDADTRLSKALSVQTAMVRARSLLADQKTQKAVEVLEDQLPKVNGNPEYLALLRDAYRAYVKDLLSAGQLEQARRYRDRLSILEPSAANDPALQPPTQPQPRKFEADPAKTTKTQPHPNFKMPNLFGKKEEPQLPAPTVRAQAGEPLVEDPFDRKNQREVSVLAPDKAKSAQEFLVRGADEFNRQHYADARISFEMAYQADQKSLDVSREQWAYCIIHGVTEAMDRPGAKFTELRQQVEGAIGMAPSKFLAKGQELMAELDRRAKQPAVSISAFRIRHLGQNKEGWMVAQSGNFRIFHRQDDELAERIAQVAETTRQAMFRKWFGIEGVDWQPLDSSGSAGCELILHPNAGSYTEKTGVPGNSPGHSKFESDGSTGRILWRRMDLRLDITTMASTVLPHETTHAVLAGMFGPFPVPRWADEGIAVLSEPEEKIAQYRRNLYAHSRDDQIFGLQELMELKDYPAPHRIRTFYAQSVVLVEFLTAQRGPKVFTEFVKDGLRSGYPAALQRHYSMTFAQLEQAWQQHVINGRQSFVSQK